MAATKSVCIVGGGTSGMIAALMLQRAYPQMKVTIIESSKIGIVGVGEGSTEHWRFFINYVDIKLHELFTETDATFKIGIKFSNWHGDGTHYFHSLLSDYGGADRFNGLHFTWLRMIGEQWPPLKTLGYGSQNSRHYEPLHDNINQFHFDTHKLNNFLHKKCKERNIEIYDDVISQVEIDNDGFIKHLIGEQQNIYSSDMYIDCSGFKRLLINKLGAKWVDKSEYLPMNSAIAFPTGYVENIPSFTEATALSSGWSWRIPTQERFGNGYVYCDSFINDTNAVAEISSHYQTKLQIDNIEVGKKFKFTAGHVDKFWIKNCVAIGLSGIFVEPLEASSIGTTIQQCANLISVLQFYSKDQEHTANRYNAIMTQVCENIVDFIQLHYFTQRDDTEFWRWCKHSLKKTDFNKENLSYFQKNNVDQNFFREPLLLFKHLNFMQVMHGLRLLDGEHSLSVYNYHCKTEYDNHIEKMLVLDGELSGSVPHRECIKILQDRRPFTEYKL